MRLFEITVQGVRLCDIPATSASEAKKAAKKRFPRYAVRFNARPV